MLFLTPCQKTLKPRWTNAKQPTKDKKEDKLTAKCLDYTGIVLTVTTKRRQNIYVRMFDYKHTEDTLYPIYVKIEPSKNSDNPMDLLPLSS